MFRTCQWVCRAVQPGRLGRIVTYGPKSSLVQFGSSGPFENVLNSQLESVNTSVVKRLGYWGVG